MRILTGVKHLIRHVNIVWYVCSRDGSRSTAKCECEQLVTRAHLINHRISSTTFANPNFEKKKNYFQLRKQFSSIRSISMKFPIRPGVWAPNVIIESRPIIEIHWSSEKCRFEIHVWFALKCACVHWAICLTIEWNWVVKLCGECVSINLVTAKNWRYFSCISRWHEHGANDDECAMRHTPHSSSSERTHAFVFSAVVIWHSHLEVSGPKPTMTTRHNLLFVMKHTTDSHQSSLCARLCRLEIILKW